MLKIVVSLIIGVCLAFIFTEHFQKDQPLSIEDQLKYRVSQYLINRLGASDVSVIANIEMTVTENAMVIERLEPQTVVAKVTTIGTANSQQPIQQPVQQASSQLTGQFNLPGMGDLYEKSDSNSSPPLTPTVLNRSNEQREQQLVEKVFYNKQVETITIKPRISSISLALFLPSEMLTSQLTENIKSELNQLLNQDEKIELLINIQPLRVSSYLLRVYSAYDAVFKWVVNHPVLFALGIFVIVLIGTLIQYIRFRMALKLRHYDKTVIVKELPQSVDKSKHDSSLIASKEIIKIDAPINDLVAYLGAPGE